MLGAGLNSVINWSCQMLQARSADGIPDFLSDDEGQPWLPLNPQFKTLYIAHIAL